MAIKISCENRNRRRTVDLAAARKAARLVLAGMGIKAAELNIVFVSDALIKAYNRRYLGERGATDVISFYEKEAAWPSAGKRNDFLGEIIISTDTVKRNAESYGSTFKKEVALCVIHGVLHLLGFLDHPARARAKMRRVENEFLQKAEAFL